MRIQQPGRAKFDVRARADEQQERGEEGLEVEERGHRTIGRGRARARSVATRCGDGANGEGEGEGEAKAEWLVVRMVYKASDGRFHPRASPTRRRRTKQSNAAAPTTTTKSTNCAVGLAWISLATRKMVSLLSMTH